MENPAPRNPMDLFRSVGNKLWKAAISKYTIVFVIALGWMFFFDRYNLISQMKVRSQIVQLEADEKFYKEGIDRLDFERERLFTDKEELERFARERYLMRRPGEDVFVVVE